MEWIIFAADITRPEGISPMAWVIISGLATALLSVTGALIIVAKKAWDARDKRDDLNDEVRNEVVPLLSSVAASLQIVTRRLETEESLDQAMNSTLISVKEDVGRIFESIQVLLRRSNNNE